MKRYVFSLSVLSTCMAGALEHMGGWCTCLCVLLFFLSSFCLGWTCLLLSEVAVVNLLVLF